MESEFENGSLKVIFKKLNDTVINGVNFDQKYKVKFAQNGDTLRKGIYLNNIAFGTHRFYDKNQLNCIRQYIIPDPFFIDLDKRNETIDYGIYELRLDSTYLNTAVFIDSKGKGLINKSHFYEAKYQKDIWNVNDSLVVDFKFHFPEHKVVKTEMYFVVPEDTSMIKIVIDSENEYRYKRKIFNEEHNKIMGVVDLIAYNESKEITDSTAHMRRIMFIDEEFLIK